MPNAPNVRECYGSRCIVCIAVLKCDCVLPCALSCIVCHSVCTHLSAHFLGNSLVDSSIVSHNPMFCRWDVQTLSMPLCLFFPLPLYRQTGKQMIILWTHYSAWSSYHNQPSRVSNLGSAKLRSVYNVAFVSVLLCYFNVGAREGSQRRTRKKEAERGRGGEGGIDCTHLHTCLRGYSTNLK